MFVVITWFLKVNLSTSERYSLVSNFERQGLEKILEKMRNFGSLEIDTGNLAKSREPLERYREPGEILEARRDTGHQEKSRES